MLKLNNLSGFGVRQVGLTTVSFIASTTSTAETITAPASINAEDLLVLFDSARATLAEPTAVTPSGFTNFISFSAISGPSSVGIRNMVSYKIADGTEDSTSITGMTGDITDNKVMLQFRGNTSISSVTSNVIGSPAVTDNNPASQTITASSGTAPMILGALYASDTTVSPRTFSAVADGEVTSSTLLYAKYKLYDTSPSNHSADMDDEGTNNSLASFYLELS